MGRSDQNGPRFAKVSRGVLFASGHLAMATGLGSPSRFEPRESAGGDPEVVDAR